MMKHTLIPLLAFFLCLTSCYKKAELNQEGFKVYNVDLDKKIKPFEEIFSKAEVIPLETTDSCLIVYCNKIYPVNDKMYIFDDWQSKVLVFSQTGNFCFQVSRKGHGPGEYLNVYDFTIDEKEGCQYILESYGRLFQYDLEGRHIKTIALPSRPNYYSITTLESGHLVTWSGLEIEEKCMLVLDKTANDTINSYWSDDRMFNILQLYPFFSYNHSTFAGFGVRQQVYEVTETELRPVYQWDFGKDNISESRLKYYMDIEHPSKRNNAILEDIGTPQLPFILDTHYQNKDYCYVSLVRETGMRPALTHVFYEKDSRQSFVFDTLDGDNCKMNRPLYFGDDYLLVDVLYESRETYKSILPESEYKKLEAMLEDDNPCLLKLYFKK